MVELVTAPVAEGTVVRVVPPLHLAEEALRLKLLLHGVKLLLIHAVVGVKPLKVDRSICRITGHSHVDNYGCRESSNGH